FGDGFAHPFEPPDDGALGDTLTELGHSDIHQHACLPHAPLAPGTPGSPLDAAARSPVPPAGAGGLPPLLYAAARARSAAAIFASLGRNQSSSTSAYGTAGT